MLEFLVDGYADVLRIDDDESFPSDFLSWMRGHDEAEECIREDMRRELMKLSS